KDKLAAYFQGAAQENVILIVVIFLLSGAFSGIAGAMGAVDSTVNMGLTFLPPSLLLSGIFIICCFVSIAMVTITRSLVAFAPLAIGIASHTHLVPALALSTVIVGAMFSYNLSFIFDITIVATRTPGVKMVEKFKVYFWLVLLGDIVNIIKLYQLF